MGPQASCAWRRKDRRHVETIHRPKQRTTRDPARRRQALKRLAYRLPGRPAAVFLLLYLLRLGFLDGRAGLHYCLLRAYYEYLIDLKVMELDRQERGLPL